MAFFEDLKRGLSVTGQTVAQKTKEIGESVQVRTQIHAEKENILKLFTAIGQQVFEEELEADAERFCTEFGSIKESLEKIEDLEVQLSEKDGCVFCTECGARITKNSAFCNKCGAKVEKKSVSETLANLFKSKETEEEVEEVSGEVVEDADGDGIFEKVEDVIDNVEDKIEDVVETVEEKLD